MDTVFGYKKEDITDWMHMSHCHVKEGLSLIKMGILTLRPDYVLTQKARVCSHTKARVHSHSIFSSKKNEDFVLKNLVSYQMFNPFLFKTFLNVG